MNVIIYIYIYIYIYISGRWELGRAKRGASLARLYSSFSVPTERLLRRLHVSANLMYSLVIVFFFCFFYHSYHDHYGYHLWRWSTKFAKPWRTKKKVKGSGERSHWKCTEGYLHDRELHAWWRVWPDVQEGSAEDVRASFEVWRAVGQNAAGTEGKFQEIHVRAWRESWKMPCRKYGASWLQELAMINVNFRQTFPLDAMFVYSSRYSNYWFIWQGLKLLYHTFRLRDRRWAE